MPRGDILPMHAKCYAQQKRCKLSGCKIPGDRRTVIANTAIPRKRLLDRPLWKRLHRRLNDSPTMAHNPVVWTAQAGNYFDPPSGSRMHRPGSQKRS